MVKLIGNKISKKSKKDKKKKKEPFKSLGKTQNKNETWIPGNKREEVIEESRNGKDELPEPPEKNGYKDISSQKTIEVKGSGVQSDLITLEKLAEYNIIIGSPDFIALGDDFGQKFQKMNLLKEVSKSQKQISNKPYLPLDKQLSDFLTNRFAVKESDPVEGNIRNILEQISVEQGINVKHASLMVKPNTILLLANGGPIKEGNTFAKKSIKELAGKSEILTEENISKAFKRDSVQLNSELNFSYVLSINQLSNEIICELYEISGKTGTPKKITDWLD